MSVQQDQERKATSFDGLDAQQVRVINEFKADLSAGETTVDDVFNHDPAETLARDEVAELVAVQREIVGNIDGQTDAASAVTLEGEVSLDSASNILDTGDELTLRNDIGGTTGWDNRSGETIDNSIIETWSAVVSNPFSSSGDSLGGGGTTFHERDMLSYRGMFGEGPTFDRHDEFHYHYHIDTAGAASSAIGQIAENRIYYWDIYENPRMR